MRQETINIYTIDDHPNPEACFEWMRDNWHDLGQNCVDDMIASLEALADATGGNLDYGVSIVPDRGEFVKLTDYDKDKLKALYKIKDDYPLTGMCYDYDVIHGLYEGDLEHQALNLLHKEGEYIYSDEGLRELCEANEYEFYESGKIA